MHNIQMAFMQSQLAQRKAALQQQAAVSIIFALKLEKLTKRTKR